MKIEIRWSVTAQADLRSAREWIRDRNRAAAVRFAEEIKNTVRLLAEFPHLGSVASDLYPEGRYRHLVKGHYRIIYRIDGRILRILRLWDCRRDPDDLIPGD